MVKLYHISVKQGPASMHKALVGRVLAMFAINFQASAAASEHSVQYYTGATLFQHCNRVIYFYLEYSEQFCPVIQPEALQFSPVTVISDTRRLRLTHKVVWSRSATCLLHIIINTGFFGGPLSQVIQFSKLRATQQLEYVLVFIAQPWHISNKTATFRSQIGQNAMALVHLLRNYQNWLVFDVDIETFEVIEATALCLYCKPDVVACTCPTSALLDSSTVPPSTRRTDFKGWPLFFLATAEFPAINVWSSLRRQPMRTFLSGTYGYTVPIYKICADIGDHLNATMRSLRAEEELKALGTMILFGGWFTYFPLARQLTVRVEGVRFVYCTNRTEAFVGDTRGLFAPFDSGTWACVLTALGGMSAIFRFTHGRTHIFHLLACLVSQARVFLGKLALLWVLWAAGSGALQNLYTSFIESVLVVPPAASKLDNFEQLYTAGYHIVIGEGEQVVIEVKRGLFGGTSYLDALRDTVEYHGKDNFDSKFLLCALNKEKKAFLIAGLQTPAVKKALTLAIPWKDCHVSKTELPLRFQGWSAIQFTAPLIHALFHRLFGSGILQLLTDSRDRRWNEFLEKSFRSAVRDAFHRASSSGTVVNGTEGGWQGLGRNDRATFDFTIGNSQLKMIFVLWLSALGLSVLMFCAEFFCSQVVTLIRGLPSCRDGSQGERWAVPRVDL